MRYRARPIVQAYSLAALRGEDRLGSVDSSDRVQLTREIIRYVRGESGGRAVLVCGAAGAGKTSIVREALQAAREMLIEDGLRPVLINLDAPSLLLPPSHENPADKRDQIYKDTELVLRRAAVALFQSVEEESWRTLHTRAACGQIPPGMTRTELVELASRLRAELSQAPTLTDLRDLWRRAGLLDGGGLFGKATDEGHGLREVLALWSAARAYHIASDTVVGETEQGNSEEASVERKTNAKWNVREALNPILGLISGVFVGASVYEESGLLAALLGTLSAVLTGLALDVTVRHFRQEKQSQTYKVTLDTTPFALTRLLPALVTHLRETGLAPVFCLDNLDRVRDQRERLDNLVGHLKSFVAEDAFFFFLADRDYYELLLNAPRGSQQGADAFTDRMLVCYRPADLRGWLERVLQPERPIQTEAERQERDLLITALMGRTQMRLGGIHRALREMSAADGGLELPEGGLTNSPMWRAYACYQAALERALGRPELAEIVGTDNHALLQALDVLYWPMSCWARDQALQPDPEAVRQLLVRQMNLDRLGVDPATVSGPPASLVNTLARALQALIDGLADPGLLTGRPELNGLQLSPLLLQTDPGRWVWKLDARGNPSGL